MPVGRVAELPWPEGGSPEGSSPGGDVTEGSSKCDATRVARWGAVTENLMASSEHWSSMLPRTRPSITGQHRSVRRARQASRLRTFSFGSAGALRGERPSLSPRPIGDRAIERTTRGRLTASSGRPTFVFLPPWPRLRNARGGYTRARRAPWRLAGHIWTRRSSSAPDDVPKRMALVVSRRTGRRQ